MAGADEPHRAPAGPAGLRFRVSGEIDTTYVARAIRTNVRFRWNRMHRLIFVGPKRTVSRTASSGRQSCVATRLTIRLQRPYLKAARLRDHIENTCSS